jgi:alcohol dehydrogenase class IV
MTPILGETRGGLKTTQRSPKILPETVIYDVDLTLSLPPGLSTTSGINAIAHAVEALYATDRNPIISLMAEDGIAALARALPAIVSDPANRSARSDALYGAWLCGACLGAVGMALHHKLCHTLGGAFDLPHAETHTVVLPHAIAYNAASAPDAMARIARALGTKDPADGIYDLAGRLGAPRALRDLGMPENGIDRAADLAAQSPYPNPRPIERAAIRDLIGRAWAGDRPGV